MSKGILIIGYGTRTGNLKEVLERTAARLRARGRKNVHICYFRVSSPTIQEAMSRMVRDGVDDILGVPYYIAEGRLTLEMIPEKMGIGATTGTKTVVDGKRINASLAPAFGMNRVLTEIAFDRIAEAGASFDDGILIMGHGSRDVFSSNEAIVRVNAERIQNRGYKHVVYAFNEFVEPGISEGVDMLAAQGVSRIVCVPLFITTGVHLNEEVPDKIGIPHYSEGGEIERGGRNISVSYMRPVEDDPRLLEIVDSEIAEFLGE